MQSYPPVGKLVDVGGHRLLWQELQADLAGLSSNGKLVVAEKGGHGIPVDQPALVVDAIRQVVETVRRASP
ncbi:MAG: hypothetical protein A2W37_02210 [Chloroflexi bacterium RBG_16_63_12]|nr:MAG: hypothetical protein A2W37_02210 [Chloroflexi bacterium RBG_16_63_12]